MYFRAVFSFLILSVIAAAAIASGPNVIDYQGRLTDPGGSPVPNGPYLLKFQLYDSKAGGNVLWNSNFRQVNVSDGLFSYPLGDTVALPDGIFDDTAIWLGIQVGADPELTPRTRLTSVPYAHSVRRIGPEVQLGNPNDTGSLEIYLGSTRVVNMGAGSTGGGLSLHDENGNFIATITRDNSGGARLHLLGDQSYINSFLIESNVDGNGSQKLTWLGDQSNLLMDMSQTGTNSVVLPDNSVDAGEIYGMPGIATYHDPGDHVITGQTSQFVDVVGLTIQTPASGYILVEATAQARFNTSTSPNFMSLQIDETSGGNQQGDYYFFCGIASATGGPAHYEPVHLQRVYQKTAGVYQFRLEALDANGSGSKALWNPTITARFFPIGYGSLVTTVADPSGFDDVKQVTYTDQESGQSRTTYQVDLRELELRAAKAKAAAKEAELELLRARNQEYMEKLQDEASVD